MKHCADSAAKGEKPDKKGPELRKTGQAFRFAVHSP